jgi:hypothetical protein
MMTSSDDDGARKAARRREYMRRYMQKRRAEEQRARRDKAARLKERARALRDPELRAMLERLAQAYEALAAERGEGEDGE